MTKGVKRLAKYTLRLDPDARQGAAHAWCMTCGMRSRETEDQVAVQGWCIGHADETGHRRYRGVVTTFFVVIP
ncbi:DUF7848 domain-containing protein [Streptomyces sp. NPDC003688]